jgi:four helix bundle protein
MPNRPNTRAILSYRDLDVWQMAVDAVVDTYSVSRAFPADERFGLTAQIRRAAVGIPSNIAEGHDRLGPGDYRRFVSMARGSVAEVETQLAIGVRLEFVDADAIDPLSTRLTRLSKMLYSLYGSLRSQ